MNVGNADVNRFKNRFANILPFDSTRVILSAIDDIEGSDYINANYISVSFCLRSIKDAVNWSYA